MEKIRINKYIANTGLCSRRKAEYYILSGRISVNGKIIKELAYYIVKDDIVELDGKQIQIEERKKYIMINKPRGYITTVKEQFGRPSILELININERVYPVGRLDMESEGLLLLTNDGDFANSIIHPAKHIGKVYEVKLCNKITSQAIKELESGIDIDGYITEPAKVRKIDDYNIEITIFEGKNRQIRRMCEKIDNSVIKLKRVAIGELKLGDLESSKYIEMDENNIKKIFK